MINILLSRHSYSRLVPFLLISSILTWHMTIYIYLIKYLSDKMSSSLPPIQDQQIDGPQQQLYSGRDRRAAPSVHLRELEKALSMTRFCEQLKRLIDQPIKIPSTLSMCPAGQSTRNKHIPGKAKRDLLSVEDIWIENPEKQAEEKGALYNIEDVGEERKWLLELLLEESDADSGGEEQITDQDLKEILKIHQKRRKFQKEYHSDLMNSQYTYYGAGLISANDRFNENQKIVRKEHFYNKDS